MKTEILQPPFGPEFDALIPALYHGNGLPVKQSQPYAKDYLHTGFLLRGVGEQLLARVALYDNPQLQLEGKPVISLGAYECVDDTNASSALFTAVFDYLQQHFPGHTVVGPMEGSTWQTYRFVTAGSDEAPFLFEPFGLPWYPAQWQASGFTPLMTYASNRADFDASDRIDFTSLQQKFEAKGLVFRNLDVSDLDGELHRLAKFNMAAFQEAFLFSPVSEVEFVEKQRKIMTALVPSLVHLVLDGDDICGLILSYPDRLDARGKTAVVKTLARLPGDRYRGLGDLLCAKIVDSLLDHGYQKMIHALMRTGNASLDNSSRFWGSKYKEYTLYHFKHPQ